MKRIFVFLTASLIVTVFTAQAQTTTSGSVDVSHFASRSRTFFPHNWVRGYTDFSVAPSHNEPDLGRCMFPQPASACCTASTCTAYPPYLYLQPLHIQPLDRTHDLLF